jgi:hypothetical protein
VSDADPLMDPPTSQRAFAYSLLAQAAAADLSALTEAQPHPSAEAVIYREQARRAIVSARSAAREAAR